MSPQPPLAKKPMEKLRLIIPSILTLRKVLRHGWGFLFTACMFVVAPSGFATDCAPAGVDLALRAALVSQGFTSKVESTPGQRLGRPLVRFYGKPTILPG